MNRTKSLKKVSANSLKLSKTDLFNVQFMCFLHRNGYMQDNLFDPENKWKLDKYINEFTKVCSYERY